MGMGKWFWEELKDDYREAKRHVEDLWPSFYYWCKGDNYSKHQFFYDLKSIWWACTCPFSQIATGFRNIKRWWMVIWEDRQFDHHYFTLILRHKLYLMEEFFYSDKTHTEDAKKYAAQIRECREILDDIINDISHDKIMEEYHKKYPYTDALSFTPCESEKERIERGFPPIYYELNQEKLSPEEEDEKYALFKECCSKSEAKDEELRKILFENLAKNLTYWWD